MIIIKQGWGGEVKIENGQDFTMIRQFQTLKSMKSLFNQQAIF
jgi:hypothetical protein